MRTTEERINRMHERAAQMEREAMNRKIKVMQIASFAVSIAAVIALAFLIPGLTTEWVPEFMPGNLYASIFSDNSALGYLVIGIVAFLLGVSVTIYCFLLKKRAGESNREKSYD